MHRKNCKILFFILFCVITYGTGQDDVPQNSQCALPNGVTGECVKYYLCNENNTVITNGETLLDTRFEANKCDDIEHVCCKLPGPTDGGTRINIATENTTVSSETSLTPTDNANFTSISNTTTLPGTCGIRRIAGDNSGVSKFGEFPWMTAIFKGDKYICGGSLIHERAILTAAHCLVSKNVTEYSVRAGEWDTNSNQAYQEKRVVFLAKHKDFYKGALFHDLAVLILDSPVEISENVGIVCLPSTTAEDPVNTNCLSSGWGKEKFVKNSRTRTVLKKVELPIVERRSCMTSLRKTRLGSKYQLHKSFICAGGQSGSDTCTGDGGSPLVCPDPNNSDRFTQYGVVSWGIGCGGDGVPGIYARVANDREWIDDQLYLNGLNVLFADVPAK